MTNPGNGKSYFVRACVAAAAAAVLVLFQNCQPGRPLSFDEQSNDISLGRPLNPEESPVYRSIEEAAAAPFSDRKVQIDKIADVPRSKIQLKANQKIILPAGERLIATIDHACLDAGRGGPVTQQATLGRPRYEGLTVQGYKWILKEPAELEVIEAAAQADPCVIGLSHDDVLTLGSKTPTDPELARQKGFLAIGGVESYFFFNHPARGARTNVVIAVIDSGTNVNHPDLKDRVWRDGANAAGYNFRTESTNVADDFGHGTFVAGLIMAAANNGLGMTGVMGHDAQLMTLKVQSGDGGAYISDIVEAINYAQSKDVDVINISMEGNGAQPTLQSALNAAVTSGTVIVVAAGNGGSILTDSNVVVPASYGAALPGMITVGSIDSYSFQKSSFSNYSPTVVEIAAPGSNGILSTDKSGGYSTNQGTSFSAPLVAGAAALTISFFKQNGVSYTPGMVESAIAESATIRSNLTNVFKQGRVLNLKGLESYLQRTYLTNMDGGFHEE